MELLPPGQEEIFRSLVEENWVVHPAKIFSNFHHHRHGHIDDDRRTHRNKRSIDKEQANAVNREIKLFPKIIADTKGPLFQK